MPIMKQTLTAKQLMKSVADPRLTIKDCGMLAILSSFKVGEEFTLEGLAEYHPDGYTTFLTYIRRLEELGYLDRRNVYDSKGRISHSEYRLYCDLDYI